MKSLSSHATMSTQQPDKRSASMIPPDRRYSQQARRSLIRARLLAQEYAHIAVDTDHVLLGIWRTEGSLGAQVLDDFNVQRRIAEEAVRDLHTSLDRPLNPTPFSRHLQAVLLYAADESYWLGHHYIGTEHILLGLIRSGTGQLSSLLYHLQLNGQQIRQRIKRLLTEGAHENPLEAMRRSGRLSELSRRVLHAASRVAEDHLQTAGLEHLLYVLAREQRSRATQWLLEAGMDVERLAQDLRRPQPDPILAATALDEVLGAAIDCAESYGTHYTGTDHLLLAMTRDDEGASLMRAYGVEVVFLRSSLEVSLRN